MADQFGQETASVVFRQFLVRSGQYCWNKPRIINVLIIIKLQMLCLIGESFDGESVLVNGAVVNVRNRVCVQFKQ